MPGSSNFLQWNPTQSNQEDDAAYSADALRSGGAPTNAIFPSPTANKAFYQWSIFVAAFAAMLADKGYTLSDADFVNLKTVLSNILTQADLVRYIVTNGSSVASGQTLVQITIPAGIMKAGSFIRVDFASSVIGPDVSLVVGGTPLSGGNPSLFGYIGIFVVSNTLCQWMGNGSFSSFAVADVTTNALVIQFIQSGAGSLTHGCLNVAVSP